MVNEIVCELLKNVGEALVEDPEELRPLKLLADKLDWMVRTCEDEDIMLLDTFVTLFTKDIFFNIFTDVSAWIDPEQRNNLTRNIGRGLIELADAVLAKDTIRVYETYKKFGRIWAYDILKLDKRNSKEITCPKHRIKWRDPVLKAFNSFPAEKCCDNILASGLKSSYHKDFDYVIIDAKVDPTDYFVREIERIKEKIQIDRLAFIDKEYGPVGAIALARSIITKTGIDGIFVRLRRRAPFDRVKIKGKIRKKANIIIISDVATSGSGILKAARIIREEFPYVNIPYAVVFYDRLQGAREKLKMSGIELIAITSPLTEKKPDRIVQEMAFDEFISRKEKEKIKEFLGEISIEPLREQDVL